MSNKVEKLSPARSYYADAYRKPVAPYFTCEVKDVFVPCEWAEHARSVESWSVEETVAHLETCDDSECLMCMSLV